MEDRSTNSEDSSQTQSSEDNEPEYLGFYKLLSLMMTDDQDLLKHKISILNDKELACLKWYTGAHSSLELIPCTLYSQARARLRKDTILRHTFLHFTTQVMTKYGFDWRADKHLKKEEALEQFITIIYGVKDKQALDYFSRCMSKGFSTKGIKAIKRACPSLIDSYFEYFERVYLLERINHFETMMRAVVNNQIKEQRLRMRRRTPPEKLTNPLSVIQTIRTVAALRLDLCREEEFLTVWKHLG